MKKLRSFGLTAMFECRCGVGIESPEMAEAFLRTSTYPPDGCMDIWAFGQLMLQLVGSSRPVEHDAKLRACMHPACSHPGSNGPDGSHPGSKVPDAMLDYLKYLADFTDSSVPVDTYAKQVSAMAANVFARKHLRDDYLHSVHVLCRHASL